jgi:sulfur-oxidizing protein SoxA
MTVLAFTARADLVHERQSLEKIYGATIPHIKPQDYLLGTLAFNAEARRQVEELMSFPPFELELDAARERWNQPFANGKTYGSCFPEAGQGASLGYPRYDSQQHRVVTFEDALNDCRVKNGEKLFSLEDKSLGLLAIVGKTLFNGKKVEVSVTGQEAQAAWEAGRAYYYQPRGAQKMSCASCHVEGVGQVMGGNPVSPLLGQGTHWPEFRNGGTQLVTLQQRFMQCNRGLGDTLSKPGSATYNNLEYFITSLSNGYPVRVPVIRP